MSHCKIDEVILCNGHDFIKFGFKENVDTCLECWSSLHGLEVDICRENLGADPAILKRGDSQPKVKGRGVPTICSHSNALIVQKNGGFQPLQIFSGLFECLRHVLQSLPIWDPLVVSIGNFQT